MSTIIEQPDWADVLRRGAVVCGVGFSLASFLLVQPTVPVTPPPPQVGQDEVVLVTCAPSAAQSTNDPHRTYFRSSHGVLQAEPAGPTAASADVDSQEAETLARSLQSLGNLSITEASRLAAVSRTTFHNWLRGEGVSIEHVGRVKGLVGALRELLDIRGSDIHAFLVTPTPAGVPLDLLRSGEREAVVGLALCHRGEAIKEPHVSGAARQMSGIPGWLRRPVRRSWLPKPLTEDQVYDLASRINPPPVRESLDPTLQEEDELPYIVHGFIPE